MTLPGDPPPPHPRMGPVPREAVSEVTLSGYRVPKGTRLWISPYATHHHPDFWERPGEFTPSVSPPRATTPSRTATPISPFGAGPRICLGMRFAMMEMHPFVARLLQRYDVRWAGRRPLSGNTVFNTFTPREAPFRLVPRPSTSRCRCSQRLASRMSTSARTVHALRGFPEMRRRTDSPPLLWRRDVERWRDREEV